MSLYFNQWIPFHQFNNKNEMVHLLSNRMCFQLKKKKKDKKRLKRRCIFNDLTPIEIILLSMYYPINQFIVRSWTIVRRDLLVKDHLCYEMVLLVYSIVAIQWLIQVIVINQLTKAEDECDRFISCDESIIHR